MAHFGRYGNLAAGEPKYAGVAPHHAGRPNAVGGFIADGPYVNTFNAEEESLLCRIFDDRDTTAAATVCLRWIGRDGEAGETFLVRHHSFREDLVRIPDECVEEFYVDVEEERDGVLHQTCFSAKVRGSK